MTHAASFAAARRAILDETPSDDDSGTPGRDAGAPLRDALRAFPRIASDKDDLPAAQQDDRLDLDLSAELEAALMNDLRSVVDLLSEEGAAAPAVGAEGRYADPDQEALDRLLASIRQTDGTAPRSERPEKPAADALDAVALGRPAVPEARTARLGRPSESRQSEGRETEPPRRPARERPVRKAAAPVAAPAPKPARATGPAKDPAKGPAGRFNRPLIAISALILLAAGGAVLTVQQVTARNEAPQAKLAESEAAPATTIDNSSAASLAPAPLEPAPEAQPAPETLAKAELPLQAPATQVAPEPALLATPAAEAEPAQAPVRIIASNGASVPPPSAAAEGVAPQAAADPSPMTAPVATLDAPAPADLSQAAPLEPAVAMATPMPKPAEPEAQATQTAASVSEASGAAAVEAPKPVAAAVKPAGHALTAGPARIASGVKLRTNPDNGAPVIGMLAAGTPLQIVSCKGWCEVVVGDKRGFVFQRFLSQS